MTAVRSIGLATAAEMLAWQPRPIDFSKAALSTTKAEASG
jgi:hypothetical protein